MYIVILAGGSGTRFWPLSRRKTPKQLMSVLGGSSMLQRTVERVLPLAPEHIFVVANKIQAGETAHQLHSYGKNLITIIEEPMGRNTAPAIGLAAAVIADRDPEAVMAVLPADHFIRDEDGFRNTLAKAEKAAAHMKLVTLGIVPSRPETGYGYIEADRAGGGEGVFPVRRFVEKPSREKAEDYIRSGSFFWNSGMFVWRADVILDRIRTHMPDLGAGLACLKIPRHRDWRAEIEPAVGDLYNRISSQSIDYGVMEKAEGVVVIPSSFGWNDVGSWSALTEVLEGDENGNVALEGSSVLSLESGNCLVLGGKKLVALVGVHDLVVVDTGDALLVCPRDRAQDVKRVTEELEKRGLAELL
jgi:mannose-1-phosphate guanylyltransferase